MIEEAGDRLIHADALAALRSLPDNSVPMIFIDPPYGVGYHSNRYKERNPHAPISNDWNFQIGRFLMEAERVLIDGGALYLCCRWDVTPLWMPYVAPSGLKAKTVIIWVKDNWTAGDLEGSFGNQYEQILFLVKGRHRLRGKRWPNVWQFSRVSAKELLHPAQKPVDLVKRAILASTDPGDVVVDCFCGSGTTGIAARETGRRYLLADIDPKMVTLTASRLGIHSPVDAPEQEDDISLPYQLETIDPAEWGIHPETLLEVASLLQSNVQHITQGQLWPLVS